MGLWEAPGGDFLGIPSGAFDLVWLGAPIRILRITAT